MTIPKELKVGGLMYDVIFSKQVADEGQVFGSTHFKNQTIYLDPDQKANKIEETFIHEALHAVWWQSGLSARHDKETPRLQEEIISALSFGIFQVLKDNDLLK